MSGAFDPSNLTALVIDDNSYQRGITLDQLRAMGFGRAVGAGGIAEALDCLQNNNPNIILLEWLAGGDQLDFVRRVRNSEDVPDRAVSIFMLTNRGAKGDVEKARRAGVNGYLRKPISLRSMQVRVRAVMVNPQPFVVTANYIGPCRRWRADPSFMGPRRRLRDDAEQTLPAIDDEELELKAQLARARVAALEACARGLAAGDVNAARAVFKAVQELVEVAEQIGDASVSLGAKEMGRYLQAQGATAQLDPDVVRTHVTALHQLVHLPHALSQERERVAQSLKRMVDKKLRATAA